MVVCGSESKQMEIRDAGSGALLLTLPHPGNVGRAEWLADRRKVVSACRDGHAYLWDVTSKPPTPIPFRHGDVVILATRTPDGEWLVSVGWNDQLRIWNTRSRKEGFRRAAPGYLRRSLQHRRQALGGLAFTYPP